MIDGIDQSLAGFDDTVLERWGLKPTAKDMLNRAKEKGEITLQEITGMVSNSLARDQRRTAEVLQEIKKILRNLNVTITLNVVHTHKRMPTIPIKKAQHAGEGHESPFLNARILQEHGLKPEALGVLLAAKDKGYISPQQIGALIPAEISQDSERLRPTMRWITQLLSGLDIKIVIGEVHYKKPESRSPETSYSLRPKSSSSNEGKPQALSHSTETSGEPSKEDLIDSEKDGESTTNGEFVPRFIFDKESGVTNPYYRAVKNHKFLKHEDLLELARRWQKYTDYGARNTIVVYNLRLSMKIAAHYIGRGLDYDDLVQEGNIGLMVAAERFDPEKGFRFTTYATWWVRHHIVRAIQNFKDIVRMPVHATESLNKILKITCDLGKDLQREPTLEEISVRAEMDVDKVNKILHQLKIQVVSLEELAFCDSLINSHYSHSGKTPLVADSIIDRSFSSPVTALEEKEELEKASLTIRTLLATIKALPVSEKIKTAFKMYYGLDGHPEGATLESIARTSGFGVTRERIRQMNTEVWEELAECGISMNDEELFAALQKVHDLENIVGIEADLSTLT